MMWQNKNGSLNLSIQAIVILVMAMAILGLGLGFIRTLIGQGQGQFEQAISNAKLKNPASSDTPITMTKTIQAKKGKTVTFEVGVYNNGDAAPAGSNEVSLLFPTDSSECPVMVSDEYGFIFNKISQTITEGEAGGFVVSLYTGANVLSGTYICTLKAGSMTKQFFVEVGS
ncbi:hypothetical protein ACFLTH_05540 [Bacteroidota bacterium]